MRKYVSLGLKGGVFISSLTGVLLAVLCEGQATTDGLGSLLYFTQQSNLWMSIISLTLFICGIVEMRKGMEVIQPWMYVVKLAFTVSITLTGLIFCFVLAPASQGAFSPWTFGNCLTHVVTPIVSVTDFFVDGYPIKFTKKQPLFSVVPPLYYFIFSIICNYAKVDFGGGSYYPYFFLNFNSPVGWFGTGGEMPYVVGTFYWVLALLALVLGLGYLYAWLHNKLYRVK